MKKKLLCTLLCLLLLCTLLPVTAVADGGTTTATSLEDVTFEYAYDAQRDPTYPTKGGNVNLSFITTPLAANGTHLSTNSGSWKLAKVGAYSTITSPSSNLTSIVTSLASKYGIENKNTIIVHELKNGTTHIAYGVVVAYDISGTDKSALFIGDNWNSDGAGYILSSRVLTGTQTFTASALLTDIINENTAPTVTMLDANGKPISSTNLPKAGDTLTAKVENAPEGKTLTYAWRISAESEANSSVVNNGITCTLKDDTAGQYISLRVTWADDGYAASGTFQIAAAEDNTPVDDPAPSTGHTPIRRQSAVTTTTADTDTTKADTVTSAKTFDAGIAVYATMAALSLLGMGYVGKKR